MKTSQHPYTPMKYKHIIFAINLAIYSQSTLSATYDLPNTAHKLPSPDLLATPDYTQNDTFFTKPSLSELKTQKIRQDYLSTLELLKNKEFKTAGKKITELIKQNPKIPAFYDLQGLLGSLTNQNKLATDSFRKAIKLSPKNIKSHLGLASALLAAGDSTQAKQHANNALAIDNQSTHSYILLAEIAYKEKKLDDVENILLTAQKKVRENGAKETAITNRLAKLYAIQKHPEKSLQLTEELIHRHPNESSALALIASTQILNNKILPAIQNLEKLIQHEQDNAPHRLLLAKLLVRQPNNDSSRILRLLDEVNTLAPSNPQVKIQATIILTQLKLFPEALKSAQVVKQLSPTTGIAEALEGEIHLANKKPHQALLAFQKSYQIKNKPKVLNVIVKLLVAANKQTEAVTLLSEALENNPKNFTAHFQLGNIYQLQKKIDQAEKHYQAILIEQPHNAIILNNLAWIYHQKNNPKALSYAKKAYQKIPNSVDIADTYAVILIKQGQQQKGLQILEKAGKQAPQNYDIQYHIADVYATNGQQAQAIKILNIITQTTHNFSEKEAAITLLKELS